MQQNKNDSQSKRIGERCLRSQMNSGRKYSAVHLHTGWRQTGSQTCAHPSLLLSGLIQTRHDVLVPFAQRPQGWDQILQRYR